MPNMREPYDEALAAAAEGVDHFEQESIACADRTVNFECTGVLYAMFIENFNDKSVHIESIQDYPKRREMTALIRYRY